MKFDRLKIDDLVVIMPTLLSDERGYFCETFRNNKLSEYLKYDISFCQENESMSEKNVFRGFHYQLPPLAQSKLVKVNYGKIIDFALDIRKNSMYFGKYFKIELSKKNKKQLFIPKGFAHGFFVLSDYAIVNYKVDNYYSKDHDRSINPLDPTINLKEINESVILSKKDLEAKNLNELELF